MEHLPTVPGAKRHAWPHPVSGDGRGGGTPKLPALTVDRDSTGSPLREIDVSNLTDTQASVVADAVALLEAQDCDSHPEDALLAWLEQRKRERERTSDATDEKGRQRSCLRGHVESVGSGTPSKEVKLVSMKFERQQGTHVQEFFMEEACSDGSEPGEQSESGGAELLEKHGLWEKQISDHSRSLQLQRGTGGSRTISDFDSTGEMLFAFDLPEEHEKDVKECIVRLPLSVIHRHIALLLANTETGEILLWNRAMESYTEIPTLAAVGTEITTFLPISEDQKFLCSCFSAMKEEGDSATSKPRMLSFMKSDGVNMSHITMTFISCKNTEHNVVMGVGVQLETSAGKLYSQWVLKQILPGLGNAIMDADSVEKQQEAQQQPLREDPSLGCITLDDDVLEAPPAGEPLERLQQRLRHSVELVERATRVDTTLWGSLNIKTTLRKLVMNYQDQLLQDVNGSFTGLNRISVQLQFADNVPDEVSTDMVRFPKSIAYLVTNAVRFSKSGGRDVAVNVLFEPFPDSPGMGYLAVEVLNEGDPIPSDVLDAVHTSDEGAAPGLVSVRRSIEGLGGSVTFARRQVMAKRKSWSLKSLSSSHSSNMGQLRTGATLQASNCPSDPVPANVAVVKIPHITPDNENEYGSMKAVSVRTTPQEILAKDSEVRTVECSAEVQQAKNELFELDGDPLIKCIVLESNPAYKITFCNHFWQRGVFTSLAESTKEVLDQLKSLDLVVIDVDEADSSAEKLLAALSESPNVQVLLASRSFTPELRKTIEDAEWLGIHLPLDARDMQKSLDELELRILRTKLQKHRIDGIRHLFGVSGNVPWSRGQLLGQGSFGKVYEAVTQLTGGKMAVKSIPRNRVNEECLLSEVKLMSELEHPNIIHYFYSEITESEFLIFMEYATEGCLSSKIPKNGCSDTEVSGYMHDITQGLLYLHSKGVAHRDIKVANVLVSHGVCKLTDFGTATKVDGRASTPPPSQEPASAGQVTMESSPVGTLVFMAPEVIEGVPVDSASDIWSLGCLVMELSSGLAPFAHKGAHFSVIRYVTSLKPGEAIDYGPTYHPPRVKDFMDQCLKVLPEDRPTCEVLMSSSLIRAAQLKKQTVLNMARDVRNKGARRSAARSRGRAMFERDIERDIDADVVLSAHSTPRGPQECPTKAHLSSPTSLCTDSSASGFSGWGDTPPAEAQPQDASEHANRLVTNTLRKSFLIHPKTGGLQSHLQQCTD
eukprot:TRINITY_DN15385_c0_g1_i1.p1 TRINITY_DN15385_c0_g1~~TRINITY_DN15385_c0_g1_i1.p1  ORF type:complete len:1221 (+),score=364.14 TRINITY_DN15385_c0_g1_i1:66-3728(+)